nr:MAG TPA: hypothetical protein [Bacteriophage sp.]
MKFGSDLVSFCLIFSIFFSKNFPKIFGSTFLVRPYTRNANFEN